MRNLNFYIDKAMREQGFSSKRKLCAALGLSPNITTMYNNGSFPTDETMVKIADLAGIDHETALLDLSIWRTAGTAAQKTYMNMLKKLTQTTACIALIALPTAAQAETKSEQMNVMEISNIYYHFYLLGHSSLLLHST